MRVSPSNQGKLIDRTAFGVRHSLVKWFDNL